MKKTLTRLFIITASLVGLSALLFPPDSSGQDLATILGQQEYRFFCASCHGRTGEGDGPMVSQLASKPPNLQMISKRYGGTFPSAEIHKIIDGRKTIRAHSTSDMPVWGDVYASVVKGMSGGGKDPGQVRIEQNINGRILSLIYYLQSIQLQSIH